MAGLAKLRQEFSGKMWLEILLVSGLNDQAEEIAGLAAAAERIGPDLVQLNTVIRPPAYPGAKALDAVRLASSAQAVSLPVQISAPPRVKTAGDRGSRGRQLVEMTRRRPCTMSDLEAMTGLEPEEVQGLVAELIHEGRLKKEYFGDQVFYRGV